MKNVYLDYAATTPVGKEVLEEMLPLLGEDFGNPDSLHSYGRRAACFVTRARDIVADVLGVQPSEVYFTSGGTESNNWAIRKLNAAGENRTIVVSNLEHRSVLSAAREAEKEGARVVYARSDSDGAVSAKEMERALEEEKNVSLVSVMAVNNETGCVQPLEEISSVCRTRGVPLFSDCVQAANALDLKKLCSLCDGVSLSGHKIYAPKGVGVLVIKRGVPVRPLIAGGEQERGLRGGTLNTAAIAGFAKALCLAQEKREETVSHLKELRSLFEGKILSALGEEVRIDGKNRAEGISHLTFSKGGEAFLNALDLNGVACSGGAACSSHAALPSHVMLAMGRSEDEAEKGVRFSFGRDTKKQDVDYAAGKVIETYKAFTKRGFA